MQIIDDFDPKSAGIRAGDRFVLSLPPETLVPGMDTIVQLRPDGNVLSEIRFKAAMDTLHAFDLLRHGGVLSKILSLTVKGSE